MAYNYFTPDYEIPEVLAEIELRGRYMMLNADLEYCLANIISLSSVFPSQIGNFSFSALYNQIDCAKASLKRYKKGYYKEYKAYFDELQSIRDITSEMAHNKIDFAEPGNLDKIRTISIEENNGKERNNKYKEYTGIYLQENLTRFAELNDIFLSLWMKLKKDAEKKSNTSKL